MTNNRNRRATRRSFGRRALAFGVAMFAMVTLTAVGFAAWLISSNSQEIGSGGIVTEDVKTAAIKVTITNKNDSKHLYDDTKADKPVYDIVFAPKENPATGDILRFSIGDSGKDKPENLTFSAKGNMENTDKIGELKFSVRVPESVLTAAGLTRKTSDKPEPTLSDLWEFDASKAYIELPSYAMDKDGKSIPKIVNGEWTAEAGTQPVKFTNVSNLSGDALTQTIDGATFKLVNTSDIAGTFECTNLGFKWGKRYDNQNPASLANTNKTDLEWGSLLTVVGIERDKAYTSQQLFLELLRMNAIINGKTLEGIINEDTGLSTPLGGKTIDEYVKYVNAEGAYDAVGVTTYLETLQTALNTKIGSSKVEYSFVIDAILN